MKSRKQRVLDYVESKDIEVFPIEIAREMSMNASTVRVYLRQLLVEGRILQPYPGSYASKITYGMMLAPLHVHNVTLQVFVPSLSFSDKVEEQYGSVKLLVLFGLERRRVTGFISCDRGMDHDTVVFAVNRFLDMVEERTGLKPSEVVVKTFELNRDVAGVRVDTCSCYTREGLMGLLERVYQKGPSVRAEVKVSRETSVDQLLALLQGGVPTANVIQGQFMIIQELKRLTAAIKFHNREHLSGGVAEV